MLLIALLIVILIARKKVHLSNSQPSMYTSLLKIAVASSDAESKKVKSLV